MDEVWANLGLVERVAKQMQIDPDLVSELGLEVMQEIRATYSADKGEFGAYARVCLRRAYSEYQADHPDSASLFTEDNGLACRQDAWFQLTFLEELEASQLSAAKLLSEELTDAEKELLHDHLVEGKTFQQLSPKYGVIKQALHKRYTKILLKLKRIAEERGYHVKNM